MGLDPGEISWIGLIVGLLATAVAVSAIGILLGAIVLLFKRGGAVAFGSAFLLGILGGAVFPISVLPGWLEAIAGVMPTKAAFDAVRSALFKGSGWGSPVITLLAFSLVALPLAVWCFGFALRENQRRATLSQY
jgi:ABC-2 type transport system permease protein